MKYLPFASALLAAILVTPSVSAQISVVQETIPVPMTQGFLGAIDGYRVAIYEPATATTFAAVRIYSRINGTWTEIVTNPVPQPPTNPPISIDLDGDRLVFGSPVGSGSDGWVSVYAQVGNTFQLVSEFQAPMGQGPNPSFGTSVAIARTAGSVLVAVGSPHELILPGPVPNGTVRTFDIGNPANPTELLMSPLFLAPVPFAASEFGHSLDVSDSGNRMIVGAPMKRHASGMTPGGAHIYNFLNGTWIEMGGSPLIVQGTLPASDLQQAGHDVAINGNWAAVGAPFYDSSRGRVRMFNLLPGGWDMGEDAQPNFNTAGASMGRRVELAGPLMVTNSNGGTSQGGVYRRVVGPPVWQQGDTNPNSTVNGSLSMSGSFVYMGKEVWVITNIGRAFCEGGGPSFGPVVPPMTVYGNDYIGQMPTSLTLTAHDLPLNEPGFFAVGGDTGTLPLTAGGPCLGDPSAPFLASGFLNSGDQGSFSVDVSMEIPFDTPVPILAGSTWYFQGIYRDGTTMKYTEAVEATF